MSVLVDHQIREWAENGGIDPFERENINPASIDLRLGGEFVNIVTGERFRADSITLVPGDAIIATTMEYIRMPATCVGKVFLKSSRAREGLDHALAGFIDPGFRGEITMEFHSHRSIVLHRGQRVIQLELTMTHGRPEKTYSGRYQGQRGPMPSRKPLKG